MHELFKKKIIHKKYKKEKKNKKGETIRVNRSYFFSLDIMGVLFYLPVILIICFSMKNKTTVQGKHVNNT